MSNIEKRINDLIDRAVHPTTNEHEARNCAYQACKLIREHKYHLTKREPLPGIDIPPTEVWEETVELAKKDAKERLENMASDLFGGTFNFADFLNGDETKKKGVGYIQTRAPIRLTCDCCHMEIKHGSAILQEFGQNAQKGNRRVTCTKDRCKASWR